MSDWKIDDLISPDVKTVGISGHVRPDGDCVGSCMGLYLYLKKNAPSLRVDVFLESTPEELKIIRDTRVIRHDFQSDVASYDLFFILDSEKSRTSGAEAHFDRAKKKVNIDHHVSNAGDGDLNYIRPEASSACELVAELMEQDHMDTDIAKALYTGIVTDTGLFHYSSTSPHTMRVAASLMEFPFEHSDLVEHVELEKTYRQNVVMGMMLTRSVLHFDGRCITAFIEYNEMQKENISLPEFDGVVSQMNLTKGVSCSIFAHGDQDGKTKISLRSKEGVNVAVIAEAFGGGGHVRASGCVMDCGAQEAVLQLLPHVQKQLA